MHKMLLAAEGAASSFDLAGTLQTATDTIQTNIFSALTIVVPTLAVVTAAVVGVKFGIKWLRSLGKG